MTATDKTIDTCNALLRGEISAIETYAQAINKFASRVPDSALQRIRADHAKNAALLRMLVTDDGGEPSTGSGLWGDFVQAIEGAATLVGESPALRILQQGEALGITEYREALANPDVSENAKNLIRLELLPHLSDNLIDLQNRRDRAA
jgi:hypothetical protein